MDLERDQFVAETSRPVPRAVLGARVKAGLWALRVFVVLVSLMVIYTFVDQLPTSDLSVMADHRAQTCWWHSSIAVCLSADGAPGARTA